MKTIDDVAAGWVAREDARPLTGEDLAARDNWLGQDTRHVGAYARAKAVFTHADRARALGPGFADGPMGSFAQERDGRGWPLHRWVTGLAAFAAVLAVVVGTVWIVDSRPARYQTSFGEVARVSLPDGSVVTLNSESRLLVDFRDDLRSMSLLEGEALFDVARDPQRPFEVRADDAKVRAIGTSFSVRRMSQPGFEVVVRSGVVDVMERRKPAIRLTRNDLASIQPFKDAQVRSLQPWQMESQLAWSDGMLSFNGVALGDAASQFSRYSKVRIIIDDPRLAERRIVGVYSATDPVGFANAVAIGMDLVVEEHAGTVTLKSTKLE